MRSPSIGGFGRPTIGPTELIIVLLIIMFVFGAGKLPEVGSALGKGIKGFRTAVRDDLNAWILATDRHYSFGEQAGRRRDVAMVVTGRRYGNAHVI